MERRAFITVVGASILAAPLAAEAQPAGKVPRVAYLTPWSDSDPGRQRGLEAFRQVVLRCYAHIIKGLEKDRPGLLASSAPARPRLEVVKA